MLGLWGLIHDSGDGDSPKLHFSYPVEVKFVVHFCLFLF
jgi:hypothetical protein